MNEIGGPPLPTDGDGDLRLEITPLSQTNGAGPQETPPKKRGRRLWGTLVAVCLFLVALGASFGSIPPLRDALTARFAHPTPLPTAGVVFPPLGPVPTNCPPGNSVVQFSPDYPPGAGIATLPIYLIGFDGPQATLRLAKTAATYGYPASMEVVAGPGVTQPFTLSINGIFGTIPQGTLALAGVTPSPRPQPLTLNPATATPGAGGYHTWSLDVYLATAGCYYLSISGTSGTFFAAGG